MAKLSVNVDHIATLRQARGVSYPDPVEAARLAEAAGAVGITVHLRGDRRHIQVRDVFDLRDAVRGKLNLEMAPTEEMVGIALDVRPDQVTLVPERPDEVTTEGGLDLRGSASAIEGVASLLAQNEIPVSLFLDPDLAQLETLRAITFGSVAGFEINTDAYTKVAARERIGPTVLAELEKIVDTAERGAEDGFAVYAGHGLTVGNVGPVAAVRVIEELNIGHSIVSRAALVGMAEAVREMLAAME